MNTPSIDKPMPLPTPIVAALNRLIRRTRHLVIIRGLCASCTAGIGAFLLIILLDASVTLLSPWTRWILSSLAYLTWAGAIFWFLIRPLTITFTLTGIARLIEIHHPELQERISSAVQLLSSRDLPSIRGSETLIAALTEEAVREVVTIRPRQEISFRSAMPFVVAATGVTVILFMIWLAWPRQTGFLLVRAAAPFLNLPNVQAVDLVVEPGNTLIAAGSALQVSVRSLNSTVTSARLRQVDRNGHESLLDMAPLPASTNHPGRRFAVTVPNVLNEFRYRVHAGGALSQYFTVRVAIPPVIEHLDIQYRYPEYSRLGVKQERDGTGTIRALVGTTVSLSAQVNKPARQATLLIISPAGTNSLSGTLRMVGKTCFYDFTLTLPKGLNGGWTLRLSDEINLMNTPFEHPIQAIPDNRPMVTITSPQQRELRLNRDTRLPVTYRAEDDHGLTAAAIVFTLPGLTNTQVRALPTPASTSESSTRVIDGDTIIAMGDSFFTNAPRVSFRIRAFDNLPASAQGPQSTDSESITLILDHQADSWIEQVLASQDQRLEQGLKQVQKKLAAAREQARALDKPLSQQQTPLSDSTTRQIDSLQDTLAATDNALRSLATDIDKGFFETLSSNLNALAETHVGKAENLAGQIRLVDTPAERMAINSNITDEITTSQDILEHAIKDHEAARTAVHRAVELEQLANQQAALAQARQEMENTPPPPATNVTAIAQAEAASKEWQQTQDKVAAELAKMTRETPGSAAQIAVALSNRATLAATQINEMAKRQADLAKLTTEEAGRLQKMDAQWHELATRQKQLADLARNEPLATAQNEAMRNAARDLEAGKKQQALETQASVYDALKQAADKLREAATPQTAAEQQLARQSQAARQLAQQAAQNAREAFESAQQAMQQAEQQVAMTEQNPEHQNQAEARDVAQQVKQSLRSAEEQMQKAQDAAREAQSTPEKTPKATATAIAKAVEATEAALETSQFATQAHQQADSLKLSELARQQVELRRDTSQNEAMLKTARDLEAGKKNQQANTSTPDDDPLLKAKTATQQAAQQAREAGLLAQQAVRNAEQGIESARQATQQAEQQAAAAKIATEKSQQAAEQASQRAKQSEGKANGEDLNRTAETASKKAAAAQQNETEAQEAAQQAKQATQAAEQQLQKAQAAAEAAQQAAQQAAEQNQKAAAATTPPSDEQAKAEAAKTMATANALTATEAAIEAGKLAALARRQADASKLAELARQQVELRKNATQNETMRNAARDLESGKNNPEKPADNKNEVGLAKTSAQKAALQAANASDLAQQAAVKAEQAVEYAKQASQQAEQQAAEARQNQAEAKEAAQQARQSLQAAEQQAQKARQASQAAQQASQQAAEQAQKADSTLSMKAIAQAKAATDKAVVNATTNAVAATEAALAAGKFATQAQQQANTFKLAELARQQVTQDQATAKNEALQKAAKDLDSGLNQPTAKLVHPENIREQPTPQQTEKQAQEAVTLAQQAAQNAEKSVEKARQAVQQAEQLAATAKQASEKSAREAQQAAQLAQQAKGKSNEQDLTRAAEFARQKSLAAQQNAVEAQEAAQKARQASQTTEQQSQKAKQAALATQQAAQQASEQAQKAAAASSLPAAEQAKAETSKAAANATTNAVVAAEAALSASKSAAQARQQTDAFKLAEIGRKQAELRQANSNNESEQKIARDLEAGKEPPAPPKEGSEASKPSPAQELVNRTAGLKAEQQDTRTPKSDAPLSQIKAAAQQAAKQAQEANTLAQQAAQMAQQASERAKQAAQQAGASEQSQQSMQAAAQQAQKAQQKASSTQQAAQRSAEQAQKAASATSTRTAHQALSETSKANAMATANALAAAEAALQANDAATRTRQQADAMKLDDLAKHQDDLRHEAAKLLAEKQTASEALRATLARQIADQQRELTETTSTLAHELDKETTPAPVASQATRAVEASQQANTEMQKGEVPNAEAAATQARQAMTQLADALRAEVTGTDPNQLGKRAEFSRLAQQADDLSKQQEQLGQLMGDLAANRPHEALQAQQELLGTEAQKMGQGANGIRAEANDILPQSPLVAQTAQAAQELTQATKAANQAAKQMQDATGHDNETENSSSQGQQQAANQTRQNQQNAAQSLQQASAKLQQAANTTAPAATSQSAPPEPEPQDFIAQAYQAARQAAQNPQAAEAAQAAAKMAQAAQQANTAAQAKGANPRPATLQTSNSNGGGNEQDSQSTEGVPSFARRMGLKLQDWLRLHGELKDDVLQAANNEGPEEYRPMIQRYFREVSGHKEEE